MRKRQAVFVTFLLLISASLGVIFLSQNTFLYQLTGGTGWFAQPLQRLFYGIAQQTTSLTRDATIADLKRQNTALQEQLKRRTLDAQEMKALRDQFDTEEVATQRLTQAAVVGSRGFIPGISLPDSLVIDKGSAHNVHVGQTVIEGKNVIGKIINVSSRYAQVQLVTASNHSVTAKTVQSGANGILKGQGNGLLQLTNLLLSDSVTPGDIVVTKGDQDITGRGYQPDLILGKVASVSKKASDLFQSANVVSNVDFARISTVFVISSN